MGGSSLDHLFIIYVVIMASGGRGVNPICTFSLNIPFFFLKAPLMVFSLSRSRLESGFGVHVSFLSAYMNTQVPSFDIFSTQAKGRELAAAQA